MELNRQNDSYTSPCTMKGKTMRYLSFIILSLFISSTGCAVDGGDGNSVRNATYDLPKQATEAVLILDYVGGFRAAPADVQPAIKILADGTVVVRNGMQGPIRSSINQNQLQSILHKIVGNHKIKTLDSASVKKAVAKAQLRKGVSLMMADVASTKIVYNDGTKKHEVLCYSLKTNLRQYPMVDELQRVAAIENILNQIRYEVVVGGKEQLQALLSSANKQLTSKYPKLLANTGEQFQFKTEHLQSAWSKPDGTLQVSLYHIKVGKTNQTSFSAQMVRPVRGSAKTTIRVHESKRTNPIK